MPSDPAKADGSAERLLAAAAKLFAGNGVAATGTRELCAAAGVTQPTLYYHFGNKEGLCRALLERFTDGFCRSLAEGLQARLPPRELLVEHAWRHLEFANRHAEPWRLATALYFGAEAKAVGFDFDAAVERELALSMQAATAAAAAGLVQRGREEAFVLALKGMVFVRTALAWKERRACRRSEAADVVRDLLDGYQPPRTPAKPRGKALARKALLALAACGLAGCNGKAEKKAEAPPPPMISVAEIAVREVQQTVEAVGTLQAFEEIPLAPKLDGRVAAIAVDIGDRIRPGQLLGQFDPTDFILNQRNAEAALKAELAKLGLEAPPGPNFPLDDVPTVRNAKVRLDNAKDRADRLATLADRRVSAAEETDEARATARMMAAELDNQRLLARSGLAVAEMKQVELDLARQRLMETKVVAPRLPGPLPGVPEAETTFALSARTVSPGTWIRAGTEVGRLTLDQALKLRVPVPERFAPDVKAGQTVEVLAAARAEQAAAGTVTRVSPVIDQRTRAFEVEIAVPNRDLALKPGGFARARIQVRVDSQGRTVPHEAVVRFAGVTKVFLIADGKAKEQHVVLGVQNREWIEIASPKLPPGTKVATSGQTLLGDGAAVTVRADAKEPGTPRREPGALATGVSAIQAKAVAE